ncbi:MAG: DUF1653 domain-containing protein [Gammaproteobacteria bacterium]|nr:DUF1653 domain-containing protein [Gammaproteobacteria bacterium]
MANNEIPCGIYQHYKNQQLYEVIGIALHTETHEEMVIYKALYSSDTFIYGQIWTRPKKMFLEVLDYNGNNVPRFKRIE